MSLIEIENLRKIFSMAVRGGDALGAVRRLLAREYCDIHAVAGLMRGRGFAFEK